MASIKKSFVMNDVKIINTMYRCVAGNSICNINSNIFINLASHRSNHPRRCSSSLSLSSFIMNHSSSNTSTKKTTINSSTRKRCPKTSYQHSQILTHNIHNSSTLLQSPQKSDQMKDEYGDMDSSGYSYIYKDNNGNTAYQLENNEILPLIEIRYQTYGTLNEKTRDNVIVICHALTGNASIHTWWNDLLGPGKPFDTEKYYFVCCNILGSCYGSTNPNSINPNTETPYGIHFPNISIKDTVRLQLNLLQKELKINSIAAVIGGSFGGMQVLEYSILGGSSQFREFHDLNNINEPYIKSVIPIACGSYHTAWQIGISEVQRQMIYHDVEWKKGNYHMALSGYQLARQLGMISYRTAAAYENKFTRKYQHEQHYEYQQSQSQYQQPSHEVQQISDDNINNSKNNNIDYGSNILWDVKSYLIYQGQKFLSRFDPITYVKLTEQMDSHNIARGRSMNSSTNDNNSSCCNNDPKSNEIFHNNIQYVLNTISIPTCIIGIDSDILYPLTEQQYLHDHIPNSELHVINSNDGHDGFLLEQKQVGDTITKFLQKQEKEQ